MNKNKKQDIEVRKPSVDQIQPEKPNKPLFDEEYFQQRQEEEKLRLLKEKSEAAYFHEMELKRLRDDLLREIKDYIEGAADISLIEKREILGLVKKFTIHELAGLMDKIIKDGIKEGLAVLKSQQKFLKGKSGHD